MSGGLHVGMIVRGSGKVIHRNAPASIRPTRRINSILVGAERFELPTLCSQSRCATRLRHAPTLSRISHSTATWRLTHSAASSDAAAPIPAAPAEAASTPPASGTPPTQKISQLCLAECRFGSASDPVQQLVVPPVRLPANVEQVPHHRNRSRRSSRSRRSPPSARSSSSEPLRATHAAMMMIDEAIPPTTSPTPGMKPDNAVQPEPDSASPGCAESRPAGATESPGARSSKTRPPQRPSRGNAAVAAARPALGDALPAGITSGLGL